MREGEGSKGESESARSANEIESEGRVWPRMRFMLLLSEGGGPAHPGGYGGKQPCSPMSASRSVLSLENSLTFSPTPITHSLSHPLTHSFTHTLTHSFTHTLTHSCTRTLIHSFTHTLTHSLTHSLIHSHTHSLIHSLTCAAR